MEKISAGRTPFRPKVRFRGSEWARWLRLVAFLFGNGIKCNGRRQTLDNDPCVALKATIFGHNGLDGPNGAEDSALAGNVGGGLFGCVRYAAEH